MDKYIGKLLDSRYEILEVIGIGGMSVVYKARCRVLNRFVAIKILKDEYARDEEFRHRFYIESQAVAKLSHNNIVSVYDVSHTDGLDYIVMELIEGVTLKEYLQDKGHLSWQETLFFTMQIARALSHAHSRGIIHQDIKPQNIMILRDGTAKVTDFGIASFATTQDTRVVQEAIGSVHYISPEQAKGSRIDFRTDLYSLGVVMYEVLTGRLPFEGDTPLAVVMQHIDAVPLMPSEIIRDIPEGVNQIVMHAMCPIMSQRYATADEMVEDLGRVKNDPAVRFPYQGAASSRGKNMSETQPLPSQEQMRRAQQVAPHKAGQAPSTGHAPKPPVKNPNFFVRVSQSPVAIAALAVCGFAVVAIVVACVLIFGGGGSTKDQLVVPTFTGKIIEDVLGNSDYTEQFVLSVGKTIEDNTVDNGTILSQSVDAGSHVEKGERITLDISQNNASVAPKNYIVEAVVGLKQAAAEAMLTRSEVLYSVVPEASEEVATGVVIRTNPEVGQELPTAAVLIVYVSSGKESEITAKMPNVVGSMIDKAEQTLAAYGLKAANKRKVASTEPENTVVSQSVAPDTEVTAADEIILEISSGVAPPDVEVPPVAEVPVEPPVTEPEAPTIGTAQITIAIPPSASNSAHIVIKLDNSDEAVFDKTYAPPGSMITATINGSGSRFATIYINDELFGEQPVTFN